MNTVKDYLLANIIPLMGDDVVTKCTGCNRQVYIANTYANYISHEIPVMCTACLYGPKEN